MLNDITLSADGLSPSWRLTNGLGTSLTGYDWSTASIYGQGGGTLKYSIIYAPPTGLAQWGIEGRDNLGGAVSSATINLPDNSVLLQQIAAIKAELDTVKTELDAVKAKTDLINTAVSVVIADAFAPVIVEIC